MLMLLLNAPTSVPSNVLVLRLVVGADEVPQTTPRAMTKLPPSALMLPPPVALVAVMLLMASVVRVGRLAAAAVVKESSLPYAVPAEFVA